MKSYTVEFKRYEDADYVYQAVLAESKVEALMHIVNTFSVYSVESVERVEDDNFFDYLLD